MRLGLIKRDTSPIARHTDTVEKHDVHLVEHHVWMIKWDTSPNRLPRETLLREAFVSRGTRYCGRRLSLAGQVRISPDTVKSRGTRLSTAGHARLPRETLASRETRSPTAGHARLPRDMLAYRGTRLPTAGYDVYRNYYRTQYCTWLRANYFVIKNVNGSALLHQNFSINIQYCAR